MVIAAYKLPRGTEGEALARSASIQGALRAAAAVPLRTAELAAQVIELAGAIAGEAKKSVVSDVAVAVIAARAALKASVVNVEINLASIADPEERKTLRVALDQHRSALIRAEAVVQTVRERIAS